MKSKIIVFLIFIWHITNIVAQEKYHHIEIETCCNFEMIRLGGHLSNGNDGDVIIQSSSFSLVSSNGGINKYVYDASYTFFAFYEFSIEGYTVYYGANEYYNLTESFSESSQSIGGCFQEYPIKFRITTYVKFDQTPISYFACTDEGLKFHSNVIDYIPYTPSFYFNGDNHYYCDEPQPGYIQTMKIEVSDDVSFSNTVVITKGNYSFTTEPLPYGTESIDYWGPDFNISFQELNHEDWKNKELFIRYYQQSGETRLFSGIFFLEPPTINLTATAPTCAESNDASFIVNLPELPVVDPELDELSYLITIARYTESKVLGSDSILYDGKYYYQNDGFTTDYQTQSSSIIVNSSNIASLAEKPFSLCAGLYRFRVRSNSGNSSDLCSVTLDTLIIAPYPIEISDVEYDFNQTDSENGTTYNIRSNGGYATMDVTITGGPNGTYELMGIEGASLIKQSGNVYRINGITAGTYDNIYIRDGLCVSNLLSKQIINEPKSFEIESIRIAEEITCYNGNGRIFIELSGGIAPFVINFQGQTINSNSRTVEIPDVKAATNGYLFIQDAGGSQIESAFTITQPSQLNLNYTIIQSIPCTGQTGSFRIYGNGGTPPYRYCINYDVNKGESQFTSYDGVFENIKDGLYSCAVMDANGCITNVNIGMYDPAPVEIYNITNTIRPTCELSNGAFDVWLDGESSYFPLNVSIYKVTGTGDSLIMQGVSNDYNEFLVRGVSAGSYKVFAESGSGCIGSSEYELIALKPLSYSNLQIKPNDCSMVETGNISFNVAGVPTPPVFRLGSPDYPISYKSGVVTISKLPAGNKSFTVSDNRGCKLNINATIPMRTDPIRIVRAIPDGPTCDYGTDGFIEVMAEGGANTNGYKYKVDSRSYSSFIPANKPYNIEMVGEGEHVVTMQDGAGCEVSTTVSNSTMPGQSLFIDIENIEPASCNQNGVNNGAATLRCRNQSFLPATFATIDYDFIATIRPGVDTTINISHLSSGMYTFWLYNDGGCSTIVNVIINSANHQAVLEKTFIDSLTCETATNGRMFLEALPNGEYTTSYQYTLTDVSENSEIAGEVAYGTKRYYDNLGNHNYRIDVVDEDGCATSEIFNVPVISDAVKLLQEDWIPSSCVRAANGRIEVTGAGGSPFSNGYDISFNNVTKRGTSVSFDNLPVGTEGQVMIYDSEGCGFISDVNIVRVLQDSLKINAINIQDPACSSVSTGVIVPDVRIGNPMAIHSYVLQSNEYNVSGELVDSIKSLPAGNYTLTITDTNNCSDVVQGIVIDNPSPVAIFDSRYNYIANKGDTTGYYHIEVDLGNYRYDYLLVDTVSSTQLYSGVADRGILQLDKIPAGVYRFMLRDTAGCNYFNGNEWFETIVDMKEPDEQLALNVNDYSNVSCNKLSDGQIYVEGTGGWGAQYEYSINGQTWQNTGVFESLVADEYQLYVRDTAGVVSVQSITLNQPDTLDFIITQLNDATCPGYGNGILEVEPLNGIVFNDGLQYRIEESETGLTIDNERKKIKYRYAQLLKGSYEVFVTDSNGCVASKTINIGEPVVPVVDIRNNYIKRKGDNTGQIGIDIEGGNGLFDYVLMRNGDSLLTGKTSDTLFLNQLYAGNYNFQLRDTAGCIYEDSAWIVRQVEIREPELELLFDTVAFNNVTCRGYGDGVLEFVGVGGWGDYSYSFNGSGFGSESVFANLNPGSYKVIVRDSSGVEFSSVVEINQPDLLTVTVRQINDANCYNGDDGSVEMEISGGNLSYLVSTPLVDWQKGEVLRGLSAGEYEIHIKDTLGCSIIIPTVTVSQPQEIKLLYAETTKTECNQNNGAIISSYTGGVGSYNYEWFKDTLVDNSIENKVLSQYTTSSISNLFSGRYLLNVTDEHSCVVPFEFFVDDNTDLTIDTIFTKPVTCYGYNNGEATAQVSLGSTPYNYTWSKDVLSYSQNNAYELFAGKYVLMVRDNEGCAVSKIFNVKTPDSIGLSYLNIIQPLCYGGSKGHIELTANGGTPGYSYKWSTGATATGLYDLDPAIYSLSVIDAQECEYQRSFELNYQRTVKPQLGNDTLICEEQPLVITPGMFTNYSWSSDNGFKSDLSSVKLFQPGTYWLEVLDNDNCIGRDTIIMAVTNLSISDLITKDVSCYGMADGEALLSILAGKELYHVNWSTGDEGLKIDSLAGGDYNVRVSNSVGCYDSLDFIINEPTALNVSSWISDPTCKGLNDGRIEVEAEGGSPGYQYEWVHGSTNNKLNNLDVGIYSLKITDANGCELRHGFELFYRRHIQPNLGMNKVLCSGNSAYLFAGIYNNYSWFMNNNFIGSDSAVVVSEVGEVVLKVQDEDGCSGSDTLSVAVRDSELNPMFLVASSVSVGDTLLIVEISQPKPDAIEWEIENLHRVVEQGDYYQKVIFDEEGLANIILTAHINGCIGETWRSVLVMPESTDKGAEPTEPAYSFISSLVVNPNPSNGNFNAHLKLQETADATIYLVSVSSGQILETRKIKGLKEYNEPFSLTNTGNYAVFAECKGERVAIKVVVK
ncbi:MAG: SprB repeat-containing protein [Marinilabiliaceae bacterium]|nr:SprB repeat-containing protein [Marinilabiliaceae bacterium]